MNETFNAIGNSAIGKIKYIIGYLTFSFKILKRFANIRLLLNPAISMTVVRQTYFAGVELVGLVTIFALIVGVLAVGGLGQLLIFLNIKESIGFMLTMVIIRTGAPIIVGLLLTLRSSTAFIIEIGQMKSRGELYSLEAMDINVYDYIYTPRVLASMISMIALSTYFAVLSIVGGYTLISFQVDTTLDSILGQIMYDIRLVDLFSFGLKTVLIGYTIASIPIYTALNISQGGTIDSIKSFQQGMIRIFIAFMLIVILSDIIIGMLP